jgi:hypothetical protein
MIAKRTFTATTDGGRGKPRKLGSEEDQAEQEVKLETKLQENAIKLERRRRNARRVVDAEEASAVEIPTNVQLDKLLIEPDDDPVYRTDEVFPLGEHGTCTAQRKTGKTTLRDNYIRSLVDGDPFLGIFHTQPIDGGLVLLDTEMSRRMSRRWFSSQGIKNTDLIDIWFMRGYVSSFNILTPAGRKRWAAEFRASEASFAILDCVADVLDTFGLSEDKDMGQLLAAWKETMEMSGIAESLLFHHMGHSNERARGSSRIRDYGFGEWKIVRAGQNDGDDNPRGTRYFSAYGRDVDVPESKLEYDPDTRRLTIAGGSRASNALSELRPKVKQFVYDNPGCSLNAVRDGVDGDNNLIGKMLAILCKEEIICMHEKGQSHRHYEYGKCPNASEHATAKTTLRRPQRGKKGP